MMTSWHGNIFCITGPLWGSSTVTGWFPSQRASYVEDWRFFIWCMPERLDKHWSWRQFETPWRSCDDIVITDPYVQGPCPCCGLEIVRWAIAQVPVTEHEGCREICYMDPKRLMMTSLNGNIFRVTGSLCGELTGHRWIPLTKASDAELL